MLLRAGFHLIRTREATGSIKGETPASFFPFMREEICIPRLSGKC